jgi:hypothetical protein
VPVEEAESSGLSEHDEADMKSIAESPDILSPGAARTATGFSFEGM